MIGYCFGLSKATSQITKFSCRYSTAMLIKRNIVYFKKFAQKALF